MIREPAARATTESQAACEWGQTRNMLHAVIQASPLAIIVLDCDHRVQLWNSEAQRLFGWTEREVLARPLPIIPESFRTRFIEQFQALIGESLCGDLSHVVEGKRLRKDGSLVNVQGWTGPYRSAKGEIVGAVGIFSDATERVRDRQHIQRQQEELARVLRFNTVGEVATTLSHELNQPLGAILNFAGVCLDSLRSGQSAPMMLEQTLEDIIQETKRADQIIRRVRGFVRKRSSQAAAIDLNEAARDAVKLVESRIERADVKLQMCFSDPLPQVCGDTVHVAQIIVNLLNNAVDSLRRVPVKQRELQMWTCVCSDTAVELRVVDRGQGIAKDMIEAVFEPFYTTRTDGLGMGLAISRSLAEAHGGRLHAEARNKGGMCFVLTLPIVQEDGRAVDAR